MGADLYLHSLYDEQKKQWEPEFERAVKARDALAEGTAAYKEAQQRVEHCFAKMYEGGYFRDPYNPVGLLLKFDLSWWQEVGDLQDEGGWLQPDATRAFLQMLREREPVFEKNLAPLEKHAQRYYREEYAALQAFLNEALNRNEGIDCCL